MSSGSAKLRIFECLAEIAQALGHANRLELLEMVNQGERTVEELPVRTGMSFANTSDTCRSCGKLGLSRRAAVAKMSSIVRPGVRR